MKQILFAVCFWIFSIPFLNAIRSEQYDLEIELDILKERVTGLEESDRNSEVEDANLHERIDLLEEKYKEIKRLYSSVKSSVSMSSTSEAPHTQPVQISHTSPTEVTTTTIRPANTAVGVLIKTLQGNRCLGETREGTVIFSTCVSGPRQLWSYSNRRVRNAETSLCLTPAKFFGSELRTEECQESNIRQIWIQNGQAWITRNGLCLVSGIRQANVAACVDNYNQKFTIESGPDVLTENLPAIPSRKFKDEQYGTCFYAASRGKCYSQPCLNSPAEEWWYSVSDYTIKNKFSCLCLDSKTEYDLTVEACNAGNTQKWIPVGSNGFRHVEFGKCLTAGVGAAMTMPCNLADKRQQFP